MTYMLQNSTINHGQRAEHEAKPDLEHGASYEAHLTKTGINEYVHTANTLDLSFFRDTDGGKEGRYGEMGLTLG
jgi:hypothetical protein